MKKQTAAQAQARLALCGLRQTAARVAVTAALLEAGGPVSQDDIAKQLGKDSPDKVTIYRTLERLFQKGAVHKAYIRQRRWHFELPDNCSERACHPHFSCRRCGQISCLTGSRAGTVKNLPAGFKVRSTQVRLEGFCPQCADA